MAYGMNNKHVWYSGDLKSGHSNMETFQNSDFLKIKYQMVWFLQGLVITKPIFLIVNTIYKNKYCILILKN